MSMHPHQVSTPAVLRRVGLGRYYGEMIVAASGRIMMARHDSDTACVVGAQFDIEINGVSIYPTSGDRAAMADGDFEVEQTSFFTSNVINVVRGDKLLLRAIITGSFGAVGGKLYSTVFIEDGLPSQYGGTSTTSFSIGTGSKAFTTQAGLAYIVGSRVLAVSAAGPSTDFMGGIVTGYSGTTLTVLVDYVGGSGTHTDWQFTIGGATGPAGATGATGATGSTGAAGSNGTNGAGYGGTSTTSFSIGTGSKAFTTQAGLAYVVGSRVRASSAAAPTVDYMEGVVTGYASTTLTATIDRAVGSGTHTDWNLSIAGDVGPVEFGVAVSDETTALTTGTAKLTFYIQQAFTLVSIWAGLSAQSTSGAVTIDVKKNGTTIFSTKITIDANEDTSLTAAAAYALTGTTTFAKGDKVTVNIDGAGTAAAGLKLFFEGVR